MLNRLKKLLMITIIAVFISGCIVSNRRNEDIQECKRYTPITEGEFRISIFLAMTEKAYAGYSLGYSELIILQTLKDDFQFWYVSHAIGDAKNHALETGLSCTEALRIAYSNEDKLKKNFIDYAISAMKDGQKKMLKYPATKSHAEKIINEHPPTAIRNSDINYRKDAEVLKEIEKKLQHKK